MAIVLTHSMVEKMKSEMEWTRRSGMPVAYVKVWEDDDGNVCIAAKNDDGLRSLGNVADELQHLRRCVEAAEVAVAETPNETRSRLGLEVIPPTA